MKNVITVLVLVLIAGISRLIPHPWNFTAVGAMALFAGARMNNKVWAFIAPFLALLWTDLVIGTHITMFYVYAAVALTTVLGFWAKDSWVKIGTSALVSSCLFFLITNFGVWMTGMYAPTFQGLMESYVMAVPFFHYQVAGDLFYTAVLFGAYQLIQVYQPSWVGAR